VVTTVQRREDRRLKTEEHFHGQGTYIRQTFRVIGSWDEPLNSVEDVSYASVGFDRGLARCSFLYLYFHMLVYGMFCVDRKVWLMTVTVRGYS
jgi:hypothetical protein